MDKVLVKALGRLKRCAPAAALGLSLVNLAACGEEAEGRSEAALDPIGIPFSQTCAGKPADADLVSSSGQAASSPTIYGTTNCPKTWVVDVEPMSTALGSRTRLSWTDRWARSKSQCEPGALKLTLLSQAPGDRLPRTEGSFTAPLIWDDVEQRCQYGKIDVDNGYTTFSGSQPLPFSVWVLNEAENVGRATAISNVSGRRLRFLASALTPAGTPQSVTVTAWADPRFDPE